MALIVKELRIHTVGGLRAATLGWVSDEEVASGWALRAGALKENGPGETPGPVQDFPVDYFWLFSISSTRRWSSAAAAA